MLNGDKPVLLVALRMAGSSDATAMPAKKIMPQYMKTTLNSVALMAYGYSHQ